MKLMKSAHMWRLYSLSAPCIQTGFIHVAKSTMEPLRWDFQLVRLWPILPVFSTPERNSCSRHHAHDTQNNKETNVQCLSEWNNMRYVSKARVARNTLPFVIGTQVLYLPTPTFQKFHTLRYCDIKEDILYVSIQRNTCKQFTTSWNNKQDEFFERKRSLGALRRLQSGAIWETTDLASQRPLVHSNCVE